MGFQALPWVSLVVVNTGEWTADGRSLCICLCLTNKYTTLKSHSSVTPFESITAGTIFLISFSGYLWRLCGNAVDLSILTLYSEMLLSSFIFILGGILAELSKIVESPNGCGFTSSFPTGHLLFLCAAYFPQPHPPKQHWMTSCSAPNSRSKFSAPHQWLCC